MKDSAPTVTILKGHVLDKLKELPDQSVHMCMTSPPYWGLRDYSRCGRRQTRQVSQDMITSSRRLRKAWSCRENDPLERGSLMEAAISAQYGPSPHSPI